jgi:hypothetical protein
LIEDNISRWGSLRIIGSTIPATISDFQEMVPTATAASSNTTGTHTSLDDGLLDLKATWIGPTSPSVPWTIRLSFATPTSAPSGTSYFVIYARSDGPVTGEAGPEVEAALYESGSLVADLGSRFLGSATGQYLIYRWESSQLGTGSGANVELLITGRPSPQGLAAEVEAASWIAGRWTMSPSLDSGWISSSDFSYSADWLSSADDVGPAPSSKALYFPSSTWQNVAYLEIHVADDQSDAEGDDIPTAAPAGYHEGGVGVLSPTYVPTHSFRAGELRFENDRPIGRTLGGQTHSGPAFVWRSITGLELIGTDAEMVAIHDRLWRARGNPFLCILDKDVPAGPLRSHAAIYGRLETGGMARYSTLTGQGVPLMAIGLNVTEVL